MSPITSPKASLNGRLDLVGKPTPRPWYFDQRLKGCALYIGPDVEGFRNDLVPLRVSYACTSLASVQGLLQ